MQQQRGNKMEKNPIVLETKIETLQDILKKFEQPDTDQGMLEAFEAIKKEIATDLLINKLSLEVQKKGTVEADTIKEIVGEYFS